MSTTRRNFIRNASLSTGGLMLLKPLEGFSTLSAKNKGLATAVQTVTIFHTNDLHNQLDAHSHGACKGYGGLNNIGLLLQQQETQPLLVDAGDFLGSNNPVAEQKAMIRKMNDLGYAAAAIGNKELTNGQAHLAMLAGGMKFRLVNCNYEFSDASLQKQVAPYHIVKWGQYRIGITGVGPELSGVEGVRFQHPYQAANAVAARLKSECDLVICLSHLGYAANGSAFNNTDFAHASGNIDIIISGHNADLIGDPRIIANGQGQEVILSHGGWGGLISRKLSITFNNERRRHAIDSRNFIASQHGHEPFYKAYRKITA